MSSVSRNCLGFVMCQSYGGLRLQLTASVLLKNYLSTKGNLVAIPEAKSPQKKGTETRIRKQLCGIMALPTKRQLVKTLLTTLYLKVEGE